MPSRSSRCSTRCSAPSEQLGRHHVLDQRRMRLLEPVEQLAHVLAAQQLGGVLADRLHQVGGEHGLAARPRCSRRPRRAPRWSGAIHTAGMPKLGSVVCDAVDRRGAAAWCRARAAGAASPRRRPPATPRSLIAYSLAGELDVVADARRRHDDAELERELLAHDADALQQVAAAGSRRPAASARSRSRPRAARPRGSRAAAARRLAGSRRGAAAALGAARRRVGAGAGATTRRAGDAGEQRGTGAAGSPGRARTAPRMPAAVHIARGLPGELVRRSTGADRRCRDEP